MKPAGADVAAALAEAVADHEQYLRRRDTLAAINRAIRLALRARQGGGAAQKRWERLASDGRLGDLVMGCEGVADVWGTRHPDVLNRLSADPLATEPLDRMVEWLRSLALAFSGAQGRRKGLAFFRALHLGYLFAAATGRAPGYTTAPRFVDTDDDVREVFSIGGPFVDFCRAVGAGDMPDRAIKDAVFVGRFAFDGVLVGAPPAPFLSAGWIGCTRSNEREKETNREFAGL